MKPHSGMYRIYRKKFTEQIIITVIIKNDVSHVLDHHQLTNCPVRNVGSIIF